MAEDSGRAFANLSEMRMRPSPMMSPEQARAYRTIMLNSSLKPSNSPVTANLQGAYSSGPRGSQLMVDPSMSANLGDALTVGGGYRTGPMGGAHGRAEIKLPAGLRALLEGSKSGQRTAVSAPVAGGELSATLARMAGQGKMPAQTQGRVGYRTPFANGGGADANGLPPEQDESLIDMATRYGQGVMRKHPIITRGLTSMATDPLDLMQWLATHGVDPEIAATMTREEMQDYQKAASSIPNSSELANKYLAQAGVRESETLPEQIGELGVSMLGPAMLAKAPTLLAKAPKAFSWGKKILGKVDDAAMREMPRMAGGAQRGTIDMGPKAGKSGLPLAAKYLPKQEISSAETSLKQVPALFKKIETVPGQRNFDIGGGKYDLGTNYLSGRGVESHVYDPFNRSPEHNAVVLNQFKQSPADSTTVANVLNVIKEPEIRKDTIQMSYDFLKPGGKAHFSIYEGSGKSARSGIGRVTRKGWQNNAPATKYEQELKSVFGDNLVRKGNTFIGEKPVADVVKAPQRPIRKSHGGAVHMGKGGLLKAGAEELVELAAKYLPKKFIPHGDPKRNDNLAKFLEGNKAPPVLYHGTPNWEGTAYNPNQPTINNVSNIKGFYADTDPETASNYALDVNKIADIVAKRKRGENLDPSEMGYGPSSQVLPVHMAIKKPFVPGNSLITKPMLDTYAAELKATNSHLSDSSFRNWAAGKVKDLAKEKKVSVNALNGDGMAYQRVLKAGGYDGLKDGTAYVAFEPTQIKSAIGNRGTFDPTKPDIGKASGGLSRVNEAGNYTKPGMRKQLFNSIKARAVQGTGAGQWSARKAQLLAKSYKEKGGGYKD